MTSGVSPSRLILILWLAWSVAVFAVEHPYQTGKIVSIQQKTRSRVLYYQVDTPVTQDDPYFEISVQIGNTIYIGDYAPRHTADTLPEDWKPGTEIKARLEKHYAFLQRPEGRELQLTLVKHEAAPISKPAAQDASSPGNSSPVK
jgi:hypothetical protein